MHVKERIKKYGITAITDEEAINLLTGIPVEEIQKNVEDYGLPELIRFRKNMPLTNLQEQMEILLKKGTKKDTISTQDGDHIGWSFFMSSTLNRSQNGNHFK